MAGACQEMRPEGQGVLGRRRPGVPGVGARTWSHGWQSPWLIRGCSRGKMRQGTAPWVPAQHSIAVGAGKLLKASEVASLFLWCRDHLSLL